MPFTPEDNTGLSGANAFGTVDEADAYHSLRDNEAWATVENKEAQLVKGADFIVWRWGDKFPGTPLLETQGLPFPRVVYDTETGAYIALPVPYLLKAANFELALLASSQPLVKRDPAPTQGALIEKTTGPLTKKWAPLGADQLAAQPSFSYVEDILRPLFATTGGRLRADRG